jgi:hypothetical protein
LGWQNELRNKIISSTRLKKEFLIVPQKGKHCKNIPDYFYLINSMTIEIYSLNLIIGNFNAISSNKGRRSIFLSEEMKTEKAHILPTNNTPEVLLNPKGIIEIKGRAIDEYETGLSKQIMMWIDSYLLNPAESTKITIALEYLNSYNSIILSSVLRKLSQVNQQSKKLVIQWYIEEDDDDLLERGKYISSTFNIPIEFIMTDDIKSWI